ncbi:uncharacterized protein MCYG_00304 [Microsporum canis CBS 113480]|uniref:Uncharacterized protein n=1 Tax=Arthroderma otae (strain ATCC MYA-4605 / CBS 113480) TaxID=554155 RepID=C5FCH2_ARTOC|nr:uncharacterized protein MCYG_00304 [Microsporum canis CBS 113480]EEQ27416.1 predicted protein [Microsporum canis CBS 113480]
MTQYCSCLRDVSPALPGAPTDVSELFYRQLSIHGAISSLSRPMTASQDAARRRRSGEVQSRCLMLVARMKMKLEVRRLVWPKGEAAGRGRTKAFFRLQHKNLPQNTGLQSTPCSRRRPRIHRSLAASGQVHVSIGYKQL